jgi:hypothetical protein
MSLGLLILAAAAAVLLCSVRVEAVLNWRDDFRGYPWPRRARRDVKLASLWAVVGLAAIVGAIWSVP